MKGEDFPGKRFLRTLVRYSSTPFSIVEIATAHRLSLSHLTNVHSFFAFSGALSDVVEFEKLTVLPGSLYIENLYGSV